MRGWNTGHPHSVSHQRPWLKGVVRYEGQLISEKAHQQPANQLTIPLSRTSLSHRDRTGWGSFRSFGWFRSSTLDQHQAIQASSGVRLSRSLGSFRGSTLDQHQAIRAGPGYGALEAWARFEVPRWTSPSRFELVRFGCGFLSLGWGVA